jgi:pimeloyl-ACP methyl ester carboxylesterase
MNDMKGEICRFRTADGVELQGLFCTPERSRAETTVVHVHGLSGNFYENRFVDYVADALVAAGVNFLTFNNRGHDYITDLLCEDAQGGLTYRTGGGAYETFRDCLTDIKAAIGLAISRGSRKVVLQGHSHGALKAAFYASQVKEAHFAGLILLSPSDDIGIQRKRLGGDFDTVLSGALKQIAAQHGHEFIPRERFEYPMSAHTYVDTFGPDSPIALFNLSRTDRHEFPELAAVSLPTLAAVGTIEEYYLGAAEQFLLDMKATMNNVPHFTGYVAKGAPHNYLGHESKIAAVIRDWVIGLND